MTKTLLADRMGMITESATLALNARAKQIASSGVTVYNLTAGELATDTPDFIQEAVKDTLHLNKYTPVAGLPKLREMIAAETNLYLGNTNYEAKNVVVTGGAKPALYAAFMALINPGDEVIVPVPAWVSYNHLIELAGGAVVEVPLTEAFDLDAHAIKANLTAKTKAIILNSPHNPTGAVFSRPALEATAEVLKGSGVTVIDDTIYEKLVYDDDFTPAGSINFEQLVIINGFSKSQALTGWRIGYMIGDEAFIQASVNLLSHVMGNASLPAQYAGIAAMEHHDKPPASTIKQLEKQRQIVADGLDAIPRLTYHLPGGGFYFFINVQEATTLSSMEWCEQLLNDKQVALVPGEAFAAPGYARLTYCADESVLTAALERIREFVNESEA